MNTGHKVIRYIALAFAIGIIFSIVSVGYHVIGFLSNGMVNNTKVSSEILKLEKDPTKKVLDIKVNAAKVNIIYGDELNATTDSEYVKITKKNNSLIITEKKHSIFKEHGTVTVTIPNSVENFDAVSIISGVGKVNSKALINTEILEVSSGVGDTTFDLINVFKKGNIEAGIGDFKIKNGELNNTQLELGIGEVKITALLLGKTKIESGIGSVNLELIGSKDDYTITAEKGIGSITVDGKSLSDDSSYGNGSNRIDIEGGIGSINVKFKVLLIEVDPNATYDMSTESQKNIEVR